LVAGRGRHDTQLAVTVDHHLTAADRHAGDAGDESAGLALPQAHGGRFRGHPGVAQVDVLVPAAQMEAGIVAQGKVAAAGGIIERIVAYGDVIDAAAVTIERLIAAGGVVVAADVTKERSLAVSGVTVTLGVVQERLGAAGGVVVAGGIIIKPVVAVSGVVV